MAFDRQGPIERMPTGSGSSQLTDGDLVTRRLKTLDERGMPAPRVPFTGEKENFSQR